MCRSEEPILEAHAAFRGACLRARASGAVCVEGGGCCRDGIVPRKVGLRMMERRVVGDCPYILELSVALVKGMFDLQRFPVRYQIKEEIHVPNVIAHEHILHWIGTSMAPVVTNVETCSKRWFTIFCSEINEWSSEKSGFVST